MLAFLASDEVIATTDENSTEIRHDVREDETTHQLSDDELTLLRDEAANVDWKETQPEQNAAHNQNF